MKAEKDAQKFVWIYLFVSKISLKYRQTSCHMSNEIPPIAYSSDGNPIILSFLLFKCLLFETNFYKKQVGTPLEMNFANRSKYASSHRCYENEKLMQYQYFVAAFYQHFSAMCVSRQKHLNENSVVIPTPADLFD